MGAEAFLAHVAGISGEKKTVLFFLQESNLKDFLEKCGKFIPFPKLYINK